MSKEDMIAEIQRVLEDANEWDVLDVYNYVMDEVAGEEGIPISNRCGEGACPRKETAGHALYA